MTAHRLHHLAELATEAARYYRRTHPAWAKAMASAAVISRIAAAHEHQGEDHPAQPELDDIKAALP